MSTKVPVSADPESVAPVHTRGSKQPHAASTLNVAHAAAGDLGYPVADFVGRCFLRLCLWVDRFAPWTRGDHAPPVFPDHLRSSRAAPKKFPDGGNAA